GTTFSVPQDQQLGVSTVPKTLRYDLLGDCGKLVRNFIPSGAHRKSTGLHTSPRQGSQQVRVVLAHADLGAAQLLDALARMQHRGVVAATEGIADLRQ